MPRKSSYEAILDAAEETVLEVGAGHMTLDLVAKRAGVSKGGLIYNFRSKDALLQAMVMRFVERLGAARARHHARLPEGPTQALQSYVLASMKRSRRDGRIGAAILAAASHNPKLVAPAREVYRKGFKEMVSEGVSAERAAIITLATEGLWLLELLGVSPVEGDMRERVRKELLHMAEDA